jgi:hypothetical protein
MTPFPMMSKPPQSPGARDPSALPEVKTIGASAVPWASIRAPRRTHSELPAVSGSPTMVVPGSMVSVAPLVTFTNPCST